MLKTTIASLALLSPLALAQYTIDTEACAGQEMIHDQNGALVAYDPAVHQVDENTPVFYRGSARIPHFKVGTDRVNYISFNNVSESAVNVFFKAKYYDFNSGQQTTHSGGTMYGVFTNANSPLSSSGASLAANTQGVVYFDFTSGYKNGIAEISWDSSTCGKEPLQVTIEHNYYQNFGSGRGSIDYYYVNDGKAF